MTDNRPWWLLLAVAEGVAIALLCMLLWGRANPMAAATGANALPAPAPADRAPATTDPPLAIARTAAFPDATPSSEPPPAGSPTAAVPSTTLLVGAVRYSDTRRVDNLSIAVFAGDATEPIAHANLYGTNDYAVPGLTPGPHRMHVRFDERQAERTFDVPAGLPMLRLDIELESPWNIRVLLVAPDGVPLHEALAARQAELPSPTISDLVQVVASWHELPPQLPATDLRESPFQSGVWKSNHGFSRRAEKLPARYAGTMELPRRRQAVLAALMRDVVLAQLSIAPEVEEATLVVDPNRWIAQLAQVRLQVVDGPGGKPVATAKVRCDDAQTHSTPQTVDADGWYESPRMIPGRYELSISADGRIGPPMEVTLAPGQTTDLGAVALAARCELRIEFPDRTTTGELRLGLRSLEAMPHPACQARGLRSSAAAGEAKLNVWPGRYRLRVDGDEVALVDFDTRALGDQPLRTRSPRLQSCRSTQRA
jgi:hypothetical protein